MCRGLGYLHACGICHRDVKPQNLLVDSRTQVLKLCDFGSAKKLSRNEASVAYICSRYYRAPELMLGSTHYTSAIDIWSIGCVLGELLLGKPLFPGETHVDQLVKIIRVLGTPTSEQMSAMNPECTSEFQFPEVKPKEWMRIFGPSVDPEVMELLSQFLQYEPHRRIKPYDALALPYFDELRKKETLLPNGLKPPNLFNWTDQELTCMSPETRAVVIPSWIDRQNI